jgi:excisionase family DNA binding protein
MDDLLTTKQLMELLQVDRTTINRMLNDGRLSGMRVGGQWRFQRQAIEKWLQEKNPPESADLKANAEDERPATRAGIDVLPLYCLEPIQEVFAQTGDVGALTTDLEGKPLTPVSNSSAFCNLILSTDNGRAQCEGSWKRLAQSSQPPRLEKCHAGLTYARGRVVVDGNFVAMFFVGQFTMEDRAALRSRAHLSQVASACGVDEKELSKFAKGLRTLEKSRAERMLGLLQLVADTYSHIGQERLELLTRLKKVAEIAGVPAVQ